MLSVGRKVRFIEVFVFFILLIRSSTSSSLENDKLAQLTERLDRMQTKMDAMRSTEIENAQLTERLDRMQTKIDYMRSREEVLEVENAQLTERLDGMQIKMDVMRSKVEVLEVENDKWTRKFFDLEAENEKLKTKTLQQDEELQHLKNKISHSKFFLSAPTRKDGQSSRILSRPPTSCQELKNQNGLWPMDGIHLLKKNNKIQAAFCIFAADGSPVSEALIGNVEVKTKTVHFYVQRSSKFALQSVVIPFELARLNEGNAFNVASGIFTVPVPGIYHFDFTALKDTSAVAMGIILQVNGANIGSAFSGPFVTGTHDSSSLSTSLRLAAGDKVNLFGSGGVLHDDGWHYTHFTGWLVEEEVM